MLGWLYDFAYEQDVRVYDASSVLCPCLGWFFWNGELDRHEKFGLEQLRGFGLSVDEIRSLIFPMQKITYCQSRETYW